MDEPGFAGLEGGHGAANGTDFGLLLGQKSTVFVGLTAYSVGWA